jgi:type I restriction enzyme S subunit
MSSELPAGWRDATIGELIDDRHLIVGDGYRAKNVELGSEGLPFARAGNVRAGFVFDGADRLLPDRISRAGHKISKVGDVVFTSKGTVGRFGFVKSTTQEFVYSPQLCFWRLVDRDVLCPRFLYFWMHGYDCRRQFDALKGQTDMADYISLRDQRSIDIAFPAVSEQRVIVSILAALDDKIENNRRLAAVLEETVASLFRAKFVDFLGIEELAQSKIGMVPRGWEVGDIYRIAKVTYGSPFKSRFFAAEDGVPLIRIRDLGKDEPGIRTPERRPDARLVRAGDVVVGMDGEFRVHLWHGPDAWLNQRVCVFDPLPGVSRAFLLEALKRPLAFFEATKGGTTVIHLGKRDIDTFRVVLPPADVMESFRAVADRLCEQVVTLRAMCRTLGAIRDALLPKLISGEMRVPATDDPQEVIGPVSAELAVAQP